MQVFAFRREKRIARRRNRCRRAYAKGMPRIPESEIEPGPGVYRAGRLEAVEAANGALESDGGRMQRADRRKFSSRTGEADHSDLSGRVLQHRQVHRGSWGLVGPQAEQRRAAGRDLARHLAPGIRRNRNARPWTMGRYALALRDDVDKGGHRFIRAIRQRSGTRRRMPAACRFRPQARARDARTSARRRPAPWRLDRAARRTRCC